MFFFRSIIMADSDSIIKVDMNKRFKADMAILEFISYELDRVNKNYIEFINSSKTNRNHKTS